MLRLDRLTLRRSGRLNRSVFNDLPSLIPGENFPVIVGRESVNQVAEFTA